MGIITIVLVSASIRYSGAWHIYIGMHPVWGWGLAGAFIVFSTVCFDIGYGMLSEDNRNPQYKFHGKHRFRVLSSGWAFIAIWFFITIYSMSSTVAGQYNQLLLKEANRSTETETYKLDSVIQDIQNKESEIKSLRNPPEISDETINIMMGDISKQSDILLEEKTDINNLLSGISGVEEAANYRTVIRDSKARLLIIEEELRSLSEDKKQLLLPVEINYDRISILQSEIEVLKITRDTLLDAGAEVQNDGDINQGTIFEYFSKIFSLSPLMIQFLLSIFPAIFIDLISPISSALFFYGLNGSGKPSEDGKTYEDGKQEAFAAVDAELERRLLEGHLQSNSE